MLHNSYSNPWVHTIYGHLSNMVWNPYFHNSLPQFLYILDIYTPKTAHTWTAADHRQGSSICYVLGSVWRTRFTLTQTCSISCCSIVVMWTNWKYADVYTQPTSSTSDDDITSRWPRQFWVWIDGENYLCLTYLCMLFGLNEIIFTVFTVFSRVNYNYEI